MYSETLLDIAMRHTDGMILKAQQGDRRAFNKLAGLWFKRIYNLAYKYFSDHDLAMEVCQGTFIQVYKSLPGLRDIQSFKPWLYRIAVNACHQEERRISKNKLSLDQVGETHIDPIRMTNFGPEKKLQHQELSRLLLEALMEISEDQRMAVIMKEYEGMKFREIAKVLEVSENTVKSRVYYGLTALRKILLDKNISKEVYYE